MVYVSCAEVFNLSHVGLQFETFQINNSFKIEIGNHDSISFTCKMPDKAKVKFILYYLSANVGCSSCSLKPFKSF